MPRSPWKSPATVLCDLFDFFPNGYLTLSRDGIINEINLTGSVLLGMERNRLIRRRFAPFVAFEDVDLWYQHFMSVKNHSGKQSCELSLRRGDGSVFSCQVG